MTEMIEKPVTKKNELQTIKPWNFFDEIDAEFQRLFERTAGIMPRFLGGALPFLRTETQMAEWLPRLDAYEKDGKLMVEVDLPGIAKKDVHISLHEGNLVIKGERKMEKEVEDESFYRNERAYGTFLRRLPLPFEVKAKDIHANFENGILNIELPIPVEARSLPVEIEVR